MGKRPALVEHERSVLEFLAPIEAQHRDVRG